MLSTVYCVLRIDLNSIVKEPESQLVACDSYVLPRSFAAQGYSIRNPAPAHFAPPDYAKQDAGVSAALRGAAQGFVYIPFDALRLLTSTRLSTTQDFAGFHLIRGITSLYI